MSQKARSIADVLKSLPVRRSRPSQENTKEDDTIPVDAGRSKTDPHPRDSQEDEEHDTDSTHDEPHLSSTVPRGRPTSSRVPPSKSPLTRVDDRSNGVEDLVSRLSRLHNTNPEEKTTDERRKVQEDPHSEESEEETHHRATSRTRSSKRYDSDDESPPRTTRRQERHRSSRDEHSDNSDNDEPSNRGHRKRDEQEEHPRRGTLSSVRPRSPRRRVEEQPRTRSKDEYDDKRRVPDERWNKPQQRGRPKHIEEVDSDDEFVDNRSADRTRDSQKNYEDENPKRSRPTRRDEDESSSSSETFSTLPKTTITKIAKTVDVGSLAADVYDTIKDLSGSFIHNVISDVSKNQEPLTSADLEPVVEKYLGRPVEDLENSDINVTTFVKWLKQVMDKYRVSLKKEAILYLHNVIELYIILLFYNAKEFAHRARRSRITSKDLELASRMK